MKKQLTSAILFAFILLSCKKENVNEPIENEVTSTENKLTAKRNPVVTLQTVYLHNTIWMSFGWEYNPTINDNGGHLMAYTINSGIISGGIRGSGSQHTWTPTQVMWSNTKGNPNVLNFIIVAQNSYIEPSRFGAVKVIREIVIIATYDVQSHVYTMGVKTTSGTQVIKN